MKNDKDFIKYLKSIYEGTNESKGVTIICKEELQITTQLKRKEQRL